MANIKVYKPNILTFQYKPVTDNEYVACSWADFLLDLDRYDMIIRSDCGNYSYTGWKPTPETESFLKLCLRFDSGYLLEKFSSRTIINSKNTMSTLKEFLEDNYLICDLDETDKGILYVDLEDSCRKYSNETELLYSIESVLDDYKIEYDSYDICCCIQKDYPVGIKTIIGIFMNDIIPKIQEYQNNN
jgi:hypothetical protein